MELWKFVLSQPSEVVEIVFSKLPIAILMVLRSKSRRLFILTKRPLETRERNARFGWNSPNEMVFEPFCKHVAPDPFLLRNFTPSTTQISFEKDADDFVHSMRPALEKGNSVFPASSLALCCEPRFTLTGRRKQKEDGVLTFGKSIELANMFGTQLTSFTIHVPFWSGINVCQFKRLFTTMSNLKCLFISNAYFHSPATSVSLEVQNPCLPQLKRLEVLKLIYCDELVCAAFLSASSQSLKYVYILNIQGIQISSMLNLYFTKTLPNLRYLSVHFKNDKILKDICSFVNKCAPMLLGLRIVCNTQVTEGSEPNIHLLFLLKHIQHLAIMTSDVGEGWGHEYIPIRNFPNLKSLYLPCWFLSKFSSTLPTYISKFSNLKRLVFLDEHEQRLGFLVIPFNYFQFAFDLSNLVSCSQFYLKFGTSRYNVKTKTFEDWNESCFVKRTVSSEIYEFL